MSEYEGWFECIKNGCSNGYGEGDDFGFGNGDGSGDGFYCFDLLSEIELYTGFGFGFGTLCGNGHLVDALLTLVSIYKTGDV